MGEYAHSEVTLPRKVGKNTRQLSLCLLTALARASAVLVVLGCAPGSGRAAAAEIDGGCLFRTHCVSCHGVSGRGDGPDAHIFAPPPSDLRKSLMKRDQGDGLVARVRTGGRTNLTLDPEGLRSQATEVEALVVYLKRVSTTNWRVADEGQAIFLCRCADCHGQYGRPPTSLPPGVRRPRDLSDPTFLGTRGDAELAQLAQHGRKGMPALIPRVSEQEGRALAAFLRLFSPGFNLYSRFCATCHCDDGRGRCSLGEVVHPPAVILDQAYFERTDPEQLRKSMWHMLAQQKPTMPHYRVQLSTEEAQAIITYLEHLN